ncbi:MAG: DMT family transporter [Immundisolibacter sp.]
MNRRARLAPHLWINLACVIWAGNMTVGRALREHVGPGLIVTLRGALSLLVLAALVRVLRRGDQPPLRTDFWRLCFMAASGVAGYQGLLYLGLRYTDAINAALMNSAAPLVAMTMAWLALGTVVRPVQWLGALLSLAGIAVILSGGRFEQLKTIQFNIGDLIMLAGVVMWAAYSVIGRGVMQSRSVLSVTAITAALSLPMVAPWGLWEVSRATPQLTPAVWAGLAYMGVFVGVGALMAWNYGVKSVGPAEAMAFMNMTPLYAVLMSTLLLHEPMRAHQLTGAVLVVGGSLLAALGPQWLGRRGTPEPAP